MRHRLGLRTGVDVGDDRVLLLRIEIERLPHVAVQVGHAVGRLDDERLGHLPADLGELRQVGLLEIHDLVAAGVAQHRHRRAIEARAVVHHVLPRRRQRRIMVGVARIHQRQAGAVEVHAVEVVVVDVFARLAGIAPEIEGRGSWCRGDDAAGAEVAASNGVLELAVAVVKVKVAPVAVLRPPDHLVGFVEVAHGRGHQAGVFETLEDQAFAFAGLQVHRAKLGVAVQAVAADEAQLVGRFAPMQVAVIFVLPFGFDAVQLFLGRAEGEHLGFADFLVAGHGVGVARQRRPGVGEGIDQEQFLDSRVSTRVA